MSRKNVSSDFITHYSLLPILEDIYKFAIGGLHNIFNDIIILIFEVFLEEVMALYCSGYLGYKNIDFT